LAYFDVDLNLLDGLSVDSGGVGSLNRLWLTKVVLNGDCTDMVTAVLIGFDGSKKYLTGNFDEKDLSTSYSFSYHDPQVPADTQYLYLTVQTPAEIQSDGLDDTAIFRRFKFPDDLPIVCGGGGQLAGNKHEIVTFNGADWAEQSGIYAETLTESDGTFSNKISGTSGGKTKSQLLIAGDRNTSLGDTHFLAMSGKSRFTMHGSAAGSPGFDMRDNAGIVMASGSFLNMEHGSTVMLHGKVHFNCSGGDTAMGGQDYGDVDKNGASIFNLHGNSHLEMTGRAGLVMHGRSYIQLSGSPVVSIHDKAVINMNATAHLNLHDDCDVSLTKDQLMLAGAKQPFGGSTSPENPTANPFFAVDGSATVMFGGSRPGKTWVKIGTNNGNVQVHLLNDCFLQMTGAAHSEMHNGSVFIMKGVLNKPYLDGIAQSLYNAQLPKPTTLWKDLSDKAKLPWYELADGRPAEKPVDSPIVEILDNAEVRLSGNISVTGNNDGLFVNGEKVATVADINTLIQRITDLETLVQGLI